MSSDPTSLQTNHDPIDIEEIHGYLLLKIDCVVGDYECLGYQIISYAEFSRLLLSLLRKVDVRLPVSQDRFIEVPMSELRNSFHLHSSLPSDLKSAYELFGHQIGDTKLLRQLMSVEIKDLILNYPLPNESAMENLSHDGLLRSSLEEMITFLKRQKYKKLSVAKILSSIDLPDKHQTTTSTEMPSWYLEAIVDEDDQKKTHTVHAGRIEDADDCLFSAFVDKDVAESLVELFKERGILFNDHNMVIQDDAAEILGNHPHGIYFYRSPNISLLGLRSLIKCGEFLIFGDKCDQFSEEEMLILSQREGELKFYAQASLSDQVAHEFSLHHGDLEISEVESLSEKSIQYLCQRKGGSLNLGIKRIDYQAAQFLSDYPEPIGLTYLQNISEDILFLLLRQRKKPFVLSEELSVKHYSAELISAMWTSPHLHFWCTLDDGYGGHGETALEWLPRQFDNLSDDLVKLLIKANASRLNLESRHILDDDLMQSLTQHSGEIWLDVEYLSDHTASMLAKHKGSINFWKLGKISEGVASNLAKYSGNITFSSLENLSVDVAKSLSEHKGNITFKQLSQVSNEVYYWLSRKKGTINDQAPDLWLALKFMRLFPSALRIH